jgi:hypothetical protein
MTVQELINELQKIEDKSLPVVKYYTEGDCNRYEEVYFIQVESERIDKWARYEPYVTNDFHHPARVEIS